MKETYLDNSATTRLDETVLNEMLPYLKEYYGNASSIYSLGRESKKAIVELMRFTLHLVVVNRITLQ